MRKTKQKTTVETVKHEERDIPIRDEKALDAVLEAQSDKKVSFAKLIFSGNRGPFFVAFPDSLTRDYAEMNALDFKTVNIADLKTFKEVPIWECGVKTQEEMDKLPKLNIIAFKDKAIKEKEAKKAARAEKMKKTVAAKKVVKQKKGKK